MSYSTGTVYKIICKLDSDIVYIGSTFNSTRNRWQVHKNDYKKYLDGKEGARVITIYPYFQKYGIENFKIIQIKEYKCYRENSSDRRHLSIYEQLWINKTRCVNMKSVFSIPIVAKKKRLEYNKEYYENNKEQLKLSHSKWYENNKEQQKIKSSLNYENNKERVKLYHEKNKEKIRDRKKKPKFCIICKKNITNNYFKAHTRTKTHIQNAKQVIYNFIISKF